MTIGITNDALLKYFLTNNNIPQAFIVNGPLSKDERLFLQQLMGFPFISNGDYVIFSKIPTDLNGLRGFVWQNGGLVTIG